MTTLLERKARQKLTLEAWLNTFIGPGRKFPSRRAFGRATGLGDHIIQQVMERGLCRLDTLFAIAEVCNVAPWFVVALATGVDPEEFGPGGGVPQSMEEQVLQRSYRQLDPATQKALLSLALAAASGSSTLGEPG